MAEEKAEKEGDSLIDFSLPTEVSIPVDFSVKQLVKIGFGLGAGLFAWALLLAVIILVGMGFLL